MARILADESRLGRARSGVPPGHRAYY